MSELLGEDDLPELPPRPAQAHKGDFGRVLIVAGAPGMTGAGVLAATAALRAGAGLLTLAAPEGLAKVLEMKCTEVMTRNLTETSEGTLAAAAAREVLELAGRMDVVALGPGLSTHKETAQVVQQLVSGLRCPAVVDADGLNALAGHSTALDNPEGPRIVTPHPGEMSRLMEHPVEEINLHRRRMAEAFAAAHRCVVVLKGAGTVVTDGELTYINQTGNPGMATAGSGDVLTGVIAGLVGQGLTALEASALGVYLHGAAGDLAAEAVGEVSLMAGDLLDYLPGAVQEYQDVR